MSDKMVNDVQSVLSYCLDMNEMIKNIYETACDMIVDENSLITNSDMLLIVNAGYNAMVRELKEMEYKKLQAVINENRKEK